MIIIPAYGRDYETAKEAQEAWDEDKDFEIYDSGEHNVYINKADAVKYVPNMEILICYNKQAELVRVNANS
jgi:hypothetical protein